jgi:hypothetical protein
VELVDTALAEAEPEMDAVLVGAELALVWDSDVRPIAGTACTGEQKSQNRDRRTCCLEGRRCTRSGGWERRCFQHYTAGEPAVLLRNPIHLPLIEPTLWSTLWSGNPPLDEVSGTRAVHQKQRLRAVQSLSEFFFYTNPAKIRPCGRLPAFHSQIESQAHYGRLRDRKRRHR